MRSPYFFLNFFFLIHPYFSYWVQQNLCLLHPSICADTSFKSAFALSNYLNFGLSLVCSFKLLISMFPNDFHIDISKSPITFLAACRISPQFHFRANYFIRNHLGICVSITLTRVFLFVGQGPTL